MLHHNLYFYGFGMPKWSPKINHLTYADDTIIFSSSCEISVLLIMDVLAAYEKHRDSLLTNRNLLFTYTTMLLQKWLTKFRGSQA